MTHILAVDAHAARARIIEPEKQLDDGRLAGAARSRNADKGAAGRREADAVEPGLAPVMREGDVVELYFAARGDKVGRAGRVFNGGFQVQKVEELFDIDGALANLAPGEAQNIERPVDIRQHQDHGRDVARLETALGDEIAGKKRDADKPRRHQEFLTGVEKGEALHGADVAVIIGAHGAVEPAGFALLRAEGFDGLEIGERVGGDGAKLRVRCIHLAALGIAPFRHRDGEPDIDRDRDDRRRAERPGIERRHHGGGERQLDDSRADVEGEKAQQEFHGAGAALDNAVQRARATGQVKLQRLGLGVREGLDRDEAVCILRHAIEERVAQLRQSVRQKARDAEHEDEDGE